MSRRTGQPTLTDERRKWDAKRLVARYSSIEPQSSVECWRKAFPGSTANDNSARVMWGRKVHWFLQNYPEELKEFGDELCRAAGLPVGDKMTPRDYKPPRWRRPRGRTERERQAITRAIRIIIVYCVLRFPLEECWRVAEPESTANPNSARILAQRIANNFIRRYPGAVQQMLDDSLWRGSARTTGRRRSRK